MENLKILREEQQRKLNKLGEEITTREETLQVLESQIKKRDKHLVSVKSRIDQLDENFSEIKNDSPGLELLQNNIKDLKNEISKAQQVYEEQRKEHQDTLEEFKEELKISQEQLRGSKKGLEDSEGIIKILNSDKKRLDNTISNLSESNKELSQAVEGYKEQKNNLDLMVSELEQANKELAEKNDEFQEELNQKKEDSFIEDDLTEDEVEDTAYPWKDQISQFKDQSLELTLDEFAVKKAKKLSTREFKQLQGLHGELDSAKDKLETYFKRPPITRTELEGEISAIQDAMADILQSAGVDRIISDPYIYSLRKVRTSFRITSESKAMQSLKQKKLGRFIKKTESINMAELRGYLLKTKTTIPGLKKTEGDVSIYIYEKHGEQYELINIIEPDGVVKFVEDFAIFKETPSFRGEFAFLSNFHNAPTPFEGITYPTSEHAYQAAKTLDPKIRETIKNLDTPGKTKRFARNIQLRPGWEKIKVGIMEKVVKSKFDNNPELMNKLLQTKRNKISLVENNTWGDRFWGVSGGKGENKLGKILTKVREENWKKSLVKISKAVKPETRDIKKITELEFDGATGTTKKAGLVGYPDRLPEKRKMGIIGSIKATPEMYKAAMHQTEQAIKGGWSIVTGGASGPDSAAMEAVLKHNDDVVKKLTVYLPKSIGDQPAGAANLLRRAKARGAIIMEYAGAQMELGLTPKFLTAEDLAGPLGDKLGAVPLQRARFARDRLISGNIDALNAIQVGRSTGTQAGINRALEKRIPILRTNENLDRVRLIADKKGKFMGNLRKILKARKLLPGVKAILMIPDIVIMWELIKKATGLVREGKGSEEDQQLVGLLKEQTEEMGEKWDEDIFADEDVFADKSYFRDNFNTELTEDQEEEFQKWLKSESKKQGKDKSLDLFDYDVRGFWEAEATLVSGHGSDKWKKPSHPTFSNESMYHDTTNKIYGGKWTGGVWGRNTFTPSVKMLNTTHSAERMKDYFKRFEPGIELILPEGFGEDVDIFVSKDLDEVLKDPIKRWKQLQADLRYLGNSAFPKLIKDEKWGDWDLKEVLKVFSKIIDVLRTKVFFPIIPPTKDEKEYKSSYWTAYRMSYDKGYMSTQPPTHEEAKEWDKKRKDIIKFSEYSNLELPETHSELIWTGTKTAIVKSKKFDKDNNDPLYLISGNKCYGIIELSEPIEINKEEFGERYSEHLVENFERIEWFGETFPLFLYNVEMVEKFEPVREV